MAYETKDNSGSLFKNDKKVEGSNQPDYQGNCMVNGKMMDMSVWIKVSKSGKKFMSMQFKPSYVKSPKSSDTDREPIPFDDDIPF